MCDQLGVAQPGFFKPGTIAREYRVYGRRDAPEGASTGVRPDILKVPTAGPSSGFSDTVVLSARDGDIVLVTDVEGQENLGSLKKILSSV